MNTQTVVHLTHSLRWIINQEKSELKPIQVFFIFGLQIPSRFSPCKPTEERVAQTSGFDHTLKVKTYCDCKMFDLANWVACLKARRWPGGTPSHEALSVSSQEELEISLVIGQPPPLVRDHFSSPRVVAKSL